VILDSWDDRPSPEDAGALLTRRERDVLAASARGAGVRDVAAELGLSVTDARETLASAIGKLGARSKLEAVILALQRGDIQF
jgi:two-component system response regulator DesR